MSVVLGTITEALGGVVAGDARSLDGTLGILRDGFTNSPRISVGANEFTALLPQIRERLDLFELTELRDAVDRNRVQPILARWLYRHHHDAGSIRPERSAKTIEWRVGDCVLYTLSDIEARLDLVSFQPGVAVLDFSVTPLDSFAGVDFRVGVEVGSVFIELSDRGEESGHYLLSREIEQSPTFQATIKLSANSKASATVMLIVTIGTESLHVPLRAQLRPAARVTGARFQRVYRQGSEFRAIRGGLAWRRSTVVRRIALELLYTINMAKRVSTQSGVRTAAQLVGLRALYWMTRPYFAVQKIWMTHDKMYSAGDSGEYMYRYMAEHTNVKPYYAVNKDSRDVERLRAEGVNLVFPRTLKHTLAYLNADVMLETHSNPASYNRFNGPFGFYFRDLVRFRILCIHHGVSVQDTHKTMHRTRSGIERMYCATKAERANSQSTRGGYSVDQVVLAGFARLDGQWEPHSREILIAPTWRPEYSGASVGLSKLRTETEGFTESIFFRLYSDIVCDPELVRAAKEAGVAIRFVLHPILASNLGPVSQSIQQLAQSRGIAPSLFDEVIRVSAAGKNISFDEAIKRAAALVTDYSGVQFDVAYPGKPIVYLHSPDLPPQYDPGAMDYATMAFGPIFSKSEAVSKYLLILLRNGMTIEGKYLKRIDEFFEHRDDKNCERIFNDAYRYVYSKDAPKVMD